MSITTKICSACRQEKTLDMYYRSKDRRSGYYNKCKVCVDNRVPTSPKQSERLPLTKRCKACGEDKELNLFPIDKKAKYGRRVYCKTCEKTRREAEGNHAEKQRIWRNNNREGYRTYARLWSYKKLGINITEEQYVSLKERQDNKCALCGNSPKQDRVLCLDHNHATGQPRGLLCNDCNIGLGKFKDDIEVLAKAIVYLSK